VKDHNREVDNNVERELQRNLQQLERQLEFYRRRGHSLQAEVLALRLEKMQRERSGFGRSAS
jgi:hypothetical protein